jgi:hypothetical protein
MPSGTGFIVSSLTVLVLALAAHADDPIKDII